MWFLEFEMGNFNIPNINRNTRFWMFRTQKGFFFNEFINQGFVAIGWNSIVAKRIEGGLSKTLESALKQEIKEEYGENIPGTALNKCKKFCFEVKEGDIALISDRGKIAFAEIGEYYEEENSKYTVEHEKTIHNDIRKARFGIDSFECPYIKRRKIKVIKILNEAAGDVVSPYLFKAIAVNRHSLSDLTEHAETILSSCFDIFTYENKTTLTVKVTKKDDIDAILFSEFVINVAEVLCVEDPQKVVVKSAIHSPGDFIFTVDIDKIISTIPWLIVYLAIFGGKIKDIEFNSLIGSIKSIINLKHDKRKKELELEEKEVAIEKEREEIGLLRQQRLSAEIENNEKLREKHLMLVDEHVFKLVKCSQDLQIDPGANNLIDISQILKIEKKEESE